MYVLQQFNTNANSRLQINATLLQSCFLAKIIR